MVKKTKKISKQMIEEKTNRFPAVGMPLSTINEEEKNAMDSDLIDRFNQIEDIQRNTTTESFLQKDKLETMKKDLISKFFEMLQQNGVDPSDLSSIRKFLVNLEKTNPDMAMLFENAFNFLFGEEGGQMPQGPMPSDQMPQGPMPQGPMPQSEYGPSPEPNLMDKYKNLGPDILRQ